MYLPSQNEQSLNKNALKSLTNTDIGSYMSINFARIIDTDWDIRIFDDSLLQCNQKDIFFNSIKIRFIILWTCLCKSINLGSFIICRYSNLKLFFFKLFWILMLDTKVHFCSSTSSLIFLLIYIRQSHTSWSRRILVFINWGVLIVSLCIA